MKSEKHQYEILLPLNWLDDEILNTLLNYYYNRMMSHKEGKITYEQYSLAYEIYDMLSEELKQRRYEQTSSY